MEVADQKIGLIQKSKWQGVNWPDEWAGHFNDVSRDNIAYKKINFFLDEAATDQVLNKLDNIFDSVDAFNTWMNGTDIVSIMIITAAISASTEYPSYTRTASLLNFTSLDMEHNSMTITIAVKSFNGSAEQKQLYKTVELVIDGAQYGVFIIQLDGTTSFSEVIKNIIKQKDLEGKL